MTHSDGSVTKQMGLSSYCAVCGEPLPERASTGRPRRTCSDRCRQRRRRGVTKPVRAQSGCQGFVTRRIGALEAIALASGITTPELAGQLEVNQSYLWRLLPQLLYEGKLEKRGRGWFLAGS